MRDNYNNRYNIGHFWKRWGCKVSNAFSIPLIPGPDRNAEHPSDIYKFYGEMDSILATTGEHVEWKGRYIKFTSNTDSYQQFARNEYGVMKKYATQQDIGPFDRMEVKSLYGWNGLVSHGNIPSITLLISYWSIEGFPNAFRPYKVENKVPPKSFFDYYESQPIDFNNIRILGIPTNKICEDDMWIEDKTSGQEQRYKVKYAYISSLISFHDVIKLLGGKVIKSEEPQVFSMIDNRK